MAESHTANWLRPACCWGRNRDQTVVLPLCLISLQIVAIRVNGRLFEALEPATRSHLILNVLWFKVLQDAQ